MLKRVMKFCTEFAINLHSRKSKKPLRRGLIQIGEAGGKCHLVQRLIINLELTVTYS